MQSELTMVKEPDKPLGDPTSIVQYRVYPQRWWILTAVVLLNLANYSHWVAFPSVAKTAAKHYDQTGEKMDLIPTVSYGLGVPCCFLATYVVERFGLRIGLHIGGVFTGIGGLLCCLSTLPHLSEGLSSESQFNLALVGQALTGIACPFISCVPTKISQHWFNDEQRALATILLGKNKSIIGLVTSNVPPTPPSPSAAQAMQQKSSKRSDYWPTIKKFFSNWPFIIIFLFVGGAMGYISTISTKIEQILCSSGYSDQLAGTAGSSILFCGFLASFPMGLISYKTKKPILVCKLSGFVVLSSLVMIGYFMRLPDKKAEIIVSCVLLGIFALGPYPVALELLVECTYPLDQAIGTAFIFLSSALQGVLLMELENHISSDLTEEKMDIQKCVDPSDHGHQQSKDYSNYLNFITVYMLLLGLLFMLFFKTEMKRTNADDSSKKAQIMSDPENQGTVEETESLATAKIA